jgi:GTP-binding protein
LNQALVAPESFEALPPVPFPARPSGYLGGMSLPVVAIVGRPNVGKSTLFNRLVGFKKSVVHDRPGVTRDRLYERAELMERQVLLVDTGGIEPDVEFAAAQHKKGPDADLLAAMKRQVMVAVEEADVIVFVVDGRAGYMVADVEVADMLRRSHKPIVLAVNKVDGPKLEDLSADFWSVGIQPMVTISAEHNLGVYDLCQAVVDRLPPPSDAEKALAAEADDDETTEERPEGDEPDDRPAVGANDVIASILVAVIGRPNIGKSTLINQILGEDRHLVHDAPGTTVDPVDSPFEIEGRSYVLVDTAGVRRKKNIEDALERFVSLRSIQAIERAHVCLLMIDAVEGITDQDAKLAQLVAERGRALIILFNKWDLVKGHDEIDAKSVEDAKEQQLPHASWAPHLFISAKTGKGVHRILPMVDTVFAAFNRHIGTPEVNRFLERVLATHTPPQKFHKPVRLYYATQNRVRPPTFVFWSNTPEGVVPAYKAYLANRLRQEYHLDGTPLKLHFRKRRNLGDPVDPAT